MPLVKKFDSIFAVVDESRKENPILLGTAFAIGGGVFATAGHVAGEVHKSQSPTLKFEKRSHKKSQVLTREGMT